MSAQGCHVSVEITIRQCIATGFWIVIIVISWVARLILGRWQVPTLVVMTDWQSLLLGQCMSDSVNIAYNIGSVWCSKFFDIMFSLIVVSCSV